MCDRFTWFSRFLYFCLVCSIRHHWFFILYLFSFTFKASLFTSVQVTIHLQWELHILLKDYLSTVDTHMGCYVTVTFIVNLAGTVLYITVCPKSFIFYTMIITMSVWPVFSILQPYYVLLSMSIVYTKRVCKYHRYIH